MGRPGFIPSDLVAAHPGQAVVRGTDQDSVRAPARWG